MERVVLAPIGSGDQPRESILGQLELFDVADARCYDPNEENRLRAAIGAVGADRFNARIRELATACREEARTA